MSVSPADALKLEGNQFIKEKKFHEAIRKFSEAIELDESNHIYYSNRSAAFLSINDVDAAIKDANQCISKNPTWAKGHARKGCALHSKRLFGKAAAAYRKALELDPTNKSYEKSVQLMEQEDRYVRGIDQRPGTTPQATPSTASSTPSTSSTSSSTAYSAAAPTSLKEALWSTTDKKVYTGFNVIRLLILFFTFGFFLSWDPNTSRSRFSYCLLLTAALYLGQIVKDHGVPQFNAAYGQRALSDWRSHYAMLALLFFSSKPKFVILMPILAHEIGNIAEFLMLVLPHVSPSILSTLCGYGNTALARLGGVQVSEWNRLPLSAKWQQHNELVLHLAAQGEVAILILLIVDLFTPSRNLLGIFAYLQFLRMRVMLSTHTKSAFQKLDQRIHPYISNVPLIGPGYEYVRKFASNMATPPQPGTSPQSGCTVM